MGECLDELRLESRRLTSKIEGYLDDALPDAYTEIGIHAEKESYKYYLSGIDCYEVKMMLSSCFKKLSSSFIDAFYDYLNREIGSIERNLDKIKDITVLLDRFNESIVEFINNELRNTIVKSIPGFIDEFKYQYNVSYENKNYIFNLEDYTQDVFNDIVSMLSRFITKYLDGMKENIISNYNEREKNKGATLDRKYINAANILDEFYWKNNLFFNDEGCKVLQAVSKFIEYKNQFENKHDLTDREIQLLDLTMKNAELACQSIDKSFSLPNDELENMTNNELLSTVLSANNDGNSFDGDLQDDNSNNKYFF